MKVSLDNNLKKYLTYTMSFIFLFILFYVLFVLIDKPLVFPNPVDVFSRTFGILGDRESYGIIFSSLGRLLISFILSLILGVILGVIASLNKYIEYFFSPIITILRAVPLATFIIILFMLLGITKSIYVIIFLMLFPLFYQNVLEGVKSIRKDLMDIWRMDSKMNLMVIKEAIIPSMFSYLKASLINAIGLGIKVLAMGELFCQTPNSIGLTIYNCKNYMDYEGVLAWSLILIALVMIVEVLVLVFKVKSE